MGSDGTECLALPTEQRDLGQGLAWVQEAIAKSYFIASFLEPVASLTTIIKSIFFIIPFLRFFEIQAMSSWPICPSDGGTEALEHCDLPRAAAKWQTVVRARSILWSLSAWHQGTLGANEGREQGGGKADSPVSFPVACTAWSG